VRKKIDTIQDEFVEVVQVVFFQSVLYRVCSPRKIEPQEIIDSSFEFNI